MTEAINERRFRAVRIQTVTEIIIGGFQISEINKNLIDRSRL